MNKQTTKKYDLPEIFRKLTDNTIPQSYVDWALKGFVSEEMTADEKKFAATATKTDIYFKGGKNCEF